MGAAEDNYILQNVSIENFPVIQWFKCDEMDSFLNRCKENGNPEALYRQGMVEYFSYVRMESGLEHLKRAADKGHVEASYVYGIILLCMGGESSIQGLKHLNAMKRSSKSKNLRILKECRERIKTILRTMWVNNHLVHHETGFCCHAQTRAIEVESWEGRQYVEDDKGCEACIWDREVALFCDMLH
ncbi:hypothetical protein U1Q18_017216 [Sarracenia purpurea var. burkii]